MKQNFTLIELLIVVAIIGLLMTLLMPSLQKAREQAHRAVCISNSKQVNTGSISFGSDNNHSLPTHKRGNNWAHGNWGHDKIGLERALAPFLGSKVPTGDHLATGNPVFMCPSSPVTYNNESGKYIWISGKGDGWGTNTYEGLYYHYSRTSINAEEPNPDNRLLRRTSYEFPDAMPTQWCSRRQAPVWTELDSSGWNNTLVGASWHKRGDRGPRPTSFLDGHVAIIKATRYTSHQNQDILNPGSTWYIDMLLSHKLEE